MVIVHISHLMYLDILMNEWKVYDSENNYNIMRERRLKCPEAMVRDPWGRVREQEEVKDSVVGAAEAGEVSAQVPAGNASVRNADARCPINRGFPATRWPAHPAGHP